jgi:hypothetical protein
MRRFRAHEDSVRKGSRPTSKDRRMLIRCYASRDQIRSDSYHRGNHALIRPPQTARRRSPGSPQTYWILIFVVASFGPDSVLPTEGRISRSMLKGLGITTLIILRETWLVVHVTGDSHVPVKKKPVKNPSLRTGLSLLMVTPKARYYHELMLSYKLTWKGLFSLAVSGPWTYPKRESGLSPSAACSSVWINYIEGWFIVKTKDRSLWPIAHLHPSSRKRVYGHSPPFPL